MRRCIAGRGAAMAGQGRAVPPATALAGAGTRTRRAPAPASSGRDGNRAEPSPHRRRRGRRRHGVPAAAVAALRRGSCAGQTWTSTPPRVEPDGNWRGTWCRQRAGSAKHAADRFPRRQVDRATAALPNGRCERPFARPVLGPCKAAHEMPAPGTVRAARCDGPHSLHVPDRARSARVPTGPRREAWTADGVSDARTLRRRPVRDRRT